MYDIIYMGYGSESDNDGRIILSVLNDNLEVRGDFFPHDDDGIPIDTDYIRDLLFRSNIVHGVQHDEIHHAFKLCNEHREVVRNVFMAKGDPPSNEVPEHLQFNPMLGQGKPLIDEEKVVDHRERSSFIIVQKDQPLAKHMPFKIGINGTNVYGGTIDFRVSKPVEVFQGENTRLEGGFLLSNINGQLVQTKGVLSVRDTLHIKGSVGYGTGNIIFPGDVQIDGIVSDGFKIYSGGSVNLKQTFDATEAVIKNDLNVTGGIIGRNQALIKVGGTIRTKFIENCRVACRKEIKVDLEILNSNVFTMETLEMGDKGRIVGGEIYALKGIKTGGIGKKSAKATRIHCGVDFTLEQEKEKNNNVLKILSGKQKQLKELMSDPSIDAEKMSKYEALKAKLDEEQEKAQNKIAELLGMLNAFDEATVEVIGEITVGTLIEICQTALVVTAPLKKVKIRLDQTKSKLLIDNI